MGPFSFWPEAEQYTLKDSTAPKKDSIPDPDPSQKPSPQIGNRKIEIGENSEEKSPPSSRGIVRDARNAQETNRKEWGS